MADSKVRARRVILGVLLFAFALIGTFQGPAMYRWLAYGAPESLNLGFSARFKKAEWLPGPPAVIPPQACPACQRGDRDSCFRESDVLTFQFPTKPGRRTVGMQTAEMLLLVEKPGQAPSPSLGIHFTLEMQNVERTPDGELCCRNLSISELPFEVEDFDCPP